MPLAAPLAALLLAASAPAAPAPAPAAAPKDWAAWNRARAKQGLLPRKPPQRSAARAARKAEPAPAVARGGAKGKRGRALVLAAVAAPPAPALEAAQDPAAAPEARPTPLHALLAGLGSGGAPAARLEVDGAGLGATLRGLRAAVAVVARAGTVTVALESGVME